MNNCFVIQPFDNDKFDQRFTDTFAPAIRKAGLEPYRVDRDPSVRVPIDEIEKGIRESVLCFAEITTDNPNVWYELGFAFACGKDVVMVCSDEREGKKFPFDIQHRSIITYTTGSKSHFETLEEDITKKIIALQSKAKTVERLNETPLTDTQGLKGHEIALLILIAENTMTPQDCFPINSLKREMNLSGYTDIATRVAIETLQQKQMIRLFQTEPDEPYCEYRITDRGMEWILTNEEQIQFRFPKNDEKLDDIPF